MKSTPRIFSLALLLLILVSGCGVISKCRYGNGFKIDIGLGKDKFNPKYLEQVQSKIKKRDSVKLPYAAITKTPLTQDPVIQIKKGWRDTGRMRRDTSKIKNSLVWKIVKNKTKRDVNDEEETKQIPTEANAKAAGILFYPSLVGAAILASVMTAELFLIFILLGLLMLIAFSLAIKSHKILRRESSGDSKKGLGLVGSIIVLYPIVSILAAILIAHWSLIALVVLFL